MSVTFRFILLFLPILALAIMVVQIEQRREASAAEMRAEAEQPAPEPAVVATAEERAFEARLQEIGAEFDGTVGIAVVDVQGERSFAHNGDALLPQQSVSKLWVAMTALSQVDEGRMDLDERVTMRHEDLTVFYQPIRNIVRARDSFTTDYADLMVRALAQSDNSANDRILRRVGGPKVVQAWLNANGVGDIHFGTDERTKQSAIAGLTWDQFYSYDDEFFKARDRLSDSVRRTAFEAYLADPIDGASAVGIARAMAKLVRGELLSPASTSLMLGILRETRSGPNRLKGGVPEGWEFGHKTGTGQFFDGEQSGYNDIGILTAPDGSRYTLSVMIGRTRTCYAARMEMMQSVTRATAAFHQARKEAAVVEPDTESAEEPAP